MTLATVFRKPSRVIVALLILFMSIAVPLFAYLDNVSATSKFDVASYTTTSPSPFDSLSNFNGLTCIVNVTTVDIVNFKFKAIVSFQPIGNLAVGGFDPLFRRPNKTLSVYLGNELISMPANVPISVQTVDIRFSSGTVNRYPFDVFSANFQLAGFSVGGDGGTSLAVVPILLGTIGAVQGFQVIVAPFVMIDDSGTTLIDVNFYAKRSFVTQFFSLFIVFSMWVISLTLFILAMTLWFRDRKVEPATIAIFTSMLFALPSIRNTQPGAPPIGATIDIAGFFWNEFLVLCSACLLMINYITKYQRDKSSATLYK